MMVVSGMSFGELRWIIESRIPWWLPFAMIAIAVVAIVIDRWRRAK